MSRLYMDDYLQLSICIAGQRHTRIKNKTQVVNRIHKLYNWMMRGPDLSSVVPLPPPPRPGWRGGRLPSQVMNGALWWLGHSCVLMTCAPGVTGYRVQAHHTANWRYQELELQPRYSALEQYPGLQVTFDNPISMTVDHVSIGLQNMSSRHYKSRHMTNLLLTLAVEYLRPI